MICGNCGKKLKSGQQFCTKCGSKIEKINDKIGQFSIHMPKKINRNIIIIGAVIIVIVLAAILFITKNQNNEIPSGTSSKISPNTNIKDPASRVRIQTIEYGGWGTTSSGLSIKVLDGFYQNTSLNLPNLYFKVLVKNTSKTPLYTNGAASDSKSGWTKKIGKVHNLQIMTVYYDQNGKEHITDPIPLEFSLGNDTICPRVSDSDYIKIGPNKEHELYIFVSDSISKPTADNTSVYKGVIIYNLYDEDGKKVSNIDNASKALVLKFPDDTLPKND